MNDQLRLEIRFHRARAVNGRGRTLAVVRQTGPGQVRWQRFILPVPPEVVVVCADIVNGTFMRPAK